MKRVSPWWCSTVRPATRMNATAPASLKSGQRIIHRWTTKPKTTRRCAKSGWRSRRSGSLFWLCKVAPSSQASAAEAQVNAAKALERFGAGDAVRPSGGRPDMHATRTLDYAVVLSGEITLILDQGEVTLKPWIPSFSAAPITPGRIGARNPR